MNYSVQQGDTMIAIAKRNNLPTYKIIAAHPKNRQLMSMRGSADRLNVGDTLFIPENPIKVLERQISTLQGLKLDMYHFREDLLTQQRIDHLNITDLGNQVDNASEILTTISLFAVKAVKHLSKKGAELAKANEELAEEIIDQIIPSPIDQAKDKAKDAVEKKLKTNVTGEEGLVLAMGKVLYQSWIDMHKPSYWAQRISGVNTDQVKAQAEREIIRTSDRTIQQLDKKIQEKSNQLKAFRTMYGFEENPSDFRIQLM